MVWEFGVVGFLIYIVWDSAGMPRPSVIRPMYICTVLHATVSHTTY